ncbi:penicillin-binding protein 1B [Alloalcanivorax mobilis]|uniref:penicillin-binding protein 1B n=1 Tax=Alloalcanivorax mobilis TaxID=2019569 RepID=UPI000B5B473C|nr:penicillin-binding protein 1B [Alloalcanivorax mobilis]ASK35177.1 penicillin-binding protein 1B [Alcanivorax sp. N3-2A]|tara:strand:- start:12269 stop:14611 length:2343 start_codon:yes stop_codon:yes gene_type:complete
MAKKPSKPASRRRPVKKGKKRTQRTGGRRWFSWRFIAKLSVVVLVLAIAGTAYLDAWVRQRFDSHVWQLPARVYARPTELYPGRVLSRDDMLRLLDLMRYRNAAGAPTAGSYAAQGNTLLIHTRGFRDSDGGEPSQTLRVTLGGGQVTRMKTGKGGSVGRLEPLQIGSIHPGHTEDRVFVPLDRVPPLLVKMLVATEDQDFYQHHGLSFRGLARAMLTNLKAGGLVQGGSTLTQQLVKNFWLTQDRTLVRKLMEMPMAVLLELHYSKQQILEAYLNEVYLGQDGGRAIHGMGLGAQFYFGRPLEELDPHQLATLVALLKGPSYYDPRRNPERSLARRNTVLRVARDEGALSENDYQRYRRHDLEVVPRGASPLYAFPAFIDLVRRQLARDYPPEVLGVDGLHIHSTLDVLSQLAAEKALREQLKRRDPAGDGLNGAVVLVAPAQGDVLAVVSSRRSREAGFNRALDAVRPIGSLVKPAVLLTALKQPDKYNLATLVNDAPLKVPLKNGDVWAPRNFEGDSLGPMPMLDVLVHSRNQATARLGMEVGLDKVADTLRELGVKRNIPLYPSILLGSLEMTPFEVAMMYQPLATGGFSTHLRSITDVLDKDGEPLARYPVDTEEVLDSGPAFLIQWAMQQVVDHGTGRAARAALPADVIVAGKTGTSDDYRDAWFAGFSANHLAVVWVGRDDNRNAGVTGATGALPVWTQLMKGLPQRSLSQRLPGGVKPVWMAPSGERRSGEGCDGARLYPMMEASIPEQGDGCGAATRAGKGVVEWFKGWFD